MKNRIITLVLFLILMLGMTGCGSDSQDTSTSESPQVTEKDSSGRKGTVEANYSELLTGLHAVEIAVEDYGTMIVELDADAAPITVTNFMHLVDLGFYDNLSFHRIMEGFMIQGGDPESNGSGGSGYEIKGEFAKNGYDNPISHKRGTISMARSNNYDSASSQFFICQEDSEFLDGDYAAFGHVIYGMETVDAICHAAEPTDNNGTISLLNQPVIRYIHDVTNEYHVSSLTGEINFPINSLEKSCGVYSFISDQDLFNHLKSGMGYAYVNLDIYGEILIVATEGCFPYEGKNAAGIAFPYMITFEPDELTNRGYFESYSDEYPLVTYEGRLYCPTPEGMDVYCLGRDSYVPYLYRVASIYHHKRSYGGDEYGGYFIEEPGTIMEQKYNVSETDSASYEAVMECYRQGEVIDFTIVP